MIEVIFTLDYEIYGNGSGSLYDLVYEPTERLNEIFRRWNARYVAFVEAAEFERIEERGTDASIDLVKKQIKELYENDFEVALHLHPQWYRAEYEKGEWLLDYSEYNLCTLPADRIVQIVDRSVDYLRHVVNRPMYTPLSFRAGNWLFQPTKTAGAALAQKGIKIDSSVFKGGVQHTHKLDYRRALRNGNYWLFSGDVNIPDPAGSLLEIPIYAEMVPFWRMLTSKRVGMQKRSATSGRDASRRMIRFRDYLRPRYPLKLDFCRMTLKELTEMTDRVIQEDRLDPATYRPLVAIGHTKDLTEPQTVDEFLSFLRANKITVSTFENVYPKLVKEKLAPSPEFFTSAVSRD
jgi:hypothetical protein